MPNVCLPSSSYDSASTDKTYRTEHPSCVWNTVNAHPIACDSDHRVQSHLSKQEQQSLEYITESPLVVADGVPAIHTFDVGNHSMVGDLVVAYGDVH